MAYNMKGFGGFKSSPKAKSFSKGLDMTLNDNLNKAVKTQNFRDAGNKTKTVSSKTNVGNKVVDAKEFLKKNTIKPKPPKTLYRPFGPGTRPFARNVSKVLRPLSKVVRGTGAFGLAAMGLYEGTKAVFKGYGKMGKTKQGKQIIKSGRMQPGKIQNMAFKMNSPLKGKRGLWDNIHAKRKRIKAGSGEKMRTPGSKGAPSAKNLKDSQ